MIAYTIHTLPHHTRTWRPIPWKSVFSCQPIEVWWSHALIALHKSLRFLAPAQPPCDPRQEHGASTPLHEAPILPTSPPNPAILVQAFALGLSICFIAWFLNAPDGSRVVIVTYRVTRIITAGGQCFEALVSTPSLLVVPSSIPSWPATILFSKDNKMPAAGASSPSQRWQKCCVTCWSHIHQFCLKCKKWR